MPGPFNTSVDIANRGLQHCGATRIASFTENSKNANAVAFCYDKLRVAELRRNVWRFATRKAILRPIDTTTMQFTPPAWSATATYLLGSVVSYLGLIYYAAGSIAAGDKPGGDTNWEQYFGPMTVSVWSSGSTYFSGEIVYIPATGSYGVYLSLQNGNSDDPTAIPDWNSATVYNLGATVTGSDTGIYQSTIDLNAGLDPTSAVPQWVDVPTTQVGQMQGPHWLLLTGAALRSIQFVYPIGTGPASQLNTRNVYQLPNGYLRVAPEDPKAGSTSFLGSPMGQLRYNDWEFEGNYLTSMESNPLMLRFVADIADVSEMDPMFCEGLSARIATEIVEDLTQSDGKLQAIGSQYKAFMTEARVINGIEVGSEEPPLDDYIACRI